MSWAKVCRLARSFLRFQVHQQFHFRSLGKMERCEMHENHVQHQFFLDFNMPKDFFERQTTAGWIIWQQSALQSPFFVED